MEKKVSKNNLPFNNLSSFSKKLFKLRTIVPNKFVRKYTEIKDKKKKKKKKKKHIEKTSGYFDDLLNKSIKMDYWQEQFFHYIKNNNNVILDIKTSCGKTWITRNIIGHLTLITMNTCLFIVPNMEILMENLNEFRKENEKNYNHNNHTMVGMSSNKFSTIINNKLPTCQVLFITSDDVIFFLCNPLNYEFINKLKYIVLDEIHMPSVSKSLRWCTLLPFDIQFILLSATLDNSNELKNTMLSWRTEKETVIIKYHIRPIPIQKCLMNRNIKLCRNGLKCKIKDIDLLYNVNLLDMTIRDIKEVSSILEIKQSPCLPKIDRNSQFKLGQEIVEKYQLKEQIQNKLSNNKLLSILIQKIQNSKEFSVKNLIVLLQYLFADNKAPVLVFSNCSNEIIEIAKIILIELEKLENKDLEIQQNKKELSIFNKLQKRQRDNNKKKQKQNNSDENFLDDENIIISPVENIKWKFPCKNKIKLKGVPEWIKKLFDMGIAIYIKSFENYIKWFMFYAFKTGNIKIMLSDESLSVGINLPARTVIILGDFSITDYHQMGGRCGRRGLDSQGFVIPLSTKEKYKYILTDFTGSNPVNIQIFKEFSLIDILRLNRKIDISFIKLKRFKKSYQNIQKQLIKKYILSSSSQINLLYEQKKQWLIKYEWINSDSIKGKISKILHIIILQCNNDNIFIFLHLFREGILDKYCIKHTNSLVEDYTKGELFMLNLLCYLFEVQYNSFTNLRPLPILIQNIIVRLTTELGNPINFKTCYNVILQFHKNGQYNIQNKKIISKFQKILFTLKQFFKELIPQFWKNNVYKALSSVDKILWKRCTMNKIIV